MFESDTIRFYLTFKGPETNDINCSVEDIIQTHNKFLVGALGNFVNRNLSFINKKFDGVITEGVIDESIIEETKKCFDVAGNYIEKGELRNAINTVIEYINLANKYYDSKEPWNQVKTDIDAFNNTTYTCLYMINNISNLIAPFMSEGSTRIKKMLNLDEYKWEESKVKGNYKIQELNILYNRIDESN